VSSAPAFAWINGRIVPEHQALVPVSDRGLLLGDSLFETIPVCNGRPFQWSAHLDRLKAGAQLTGIDSTLSPADWSNALAALLTANQAVHGSVRLTVTRGSGTRGYSPRGANSPNRFLTWHPSLPVANPHPGWLLRSSPYRIDPQLPLHSIKHGSRLLQILARADAEAHGADEALMLDTSGNAVEGSSGNLFWIQDQTLCTPPHGGGALPGVTADFIHRHARSLGWPMAFDRVGTDRIAHADGAFLTLSTLGVVPILSLDRVPLPAHPWIRRLATDLIRAMWAPNESTALHPG